MKQTTKKAVYQKPLIEVISVENEGGIMVGSGRISDVGHGGNIFQSSGAKSSGTSRTGTKYRSQSPLQELEDIINDLLTY